MRVTRRGVRSSDPLFPATAALQLSEPGGGQYPLRHVPGVLRPFAATLAVPAPAAGKKHDTSDTRNSTTESTQDSHDGVVVPDTIRDTTTDT